jgi:hypothetical protein
MTDQEQLTIDLWLLDAVLTGEDPRSGRGNPDLQVDLERFVLGELHYLSDGGYSRVFHSEDKRKLCLSSESREEVRLKWDSSPANAIKFRIKAVIDRWIKSHE